MKTLIERLQKENERLKSESAENRELWSESERNYQQAQDKIKEQKEGMETIADLTECKLTEAAIRELLSKLETKPTDTKENG